jgi:hypothetical protein
LVFLPIKISLLTRLAALQEGFVCLDQIDATKEFEKARAGDLVEDIQTALFTLQQTRTPHHSEMLGECRDITSRKIREIVYTFLPLRENIHHQQTRRVGHRFDDDRPVFGRKSGCFDVHIYLAFLPINKYEVNRVSHPVK